MKRIWLLIAVAVVTACGSEKPADSKPSSPHELLETQLDALEKAKQVEGSLQDAVDEREQAMRERGI